MRRSLLALSLVFVMTALPAYAHAPRPGPNGGLKVDAGANHHVELVVGRDEVPVGVLLLTEMPLGVAESSLLQEAAAPLPRSRARAIRARRAFMAGFRGGSGSDASRARLNRHRLAQASFSRAFACARPR